MSNSSATVPASEKEELPKVSYNEEEYVIQLWRNGRWERHGFPLYALPTCLVVENPKNIPVACSQLHIVIPKDLTGTLYCLRFGAPEFGIGATDRGIYLHSRAEAKCITKKLAEFEAKDKK